MTVEFAKSIVFINLIFQQLLKNVNRKVQGVPQSEATTTGGKDLSLSTNVILGPEVILNTKIHNKFGSHNGSLTESMHHSENPKIQTDHYDEKRRVLLANPTPTASQCYSHPLVEPRRSKLNT